jgi:hypothetical protein
MNGTHFPITSFGEKPIMPEILEIRFKGYYKYLKSNTWSQILEVLNIPVVSK